MRSLAALIVAGPLQAVLVMLAFTAASFLAPPLTSILGYGAAAALALYTLRKGAAAGVTVLLGALLATALLTQLLWQQGVAVAVTSLLLWLPVWLAATVLRSTISLAMAMLVLSGLAMAGVLLAFVLYGDPTPWWLAQLGDLVDSLLKAQPELQGERGQLMEVAAQLAPYMTGSLAAALSFAALACLLLGRWWQSLLVKPGGLREEFYGLRLNRTLSLLAVAILVLASLHLGVLSALATQWSLVVLVLYLFVGLGVIHAALANRKAGRGWLIALYVLMSLLPQVLVLVAVTGIVDPWLDLRRRTRGTETN